MALRGEGASVWQVRPGPLLMESRGLRLKIRTSVRQSRFLENSVSVIFAIVNIWRVSGEMDSSISHLHKLMHLVLPNKSCAGRTDSQRSLRSCPQAWCGEWQGLHSMPRVERAGLALRSQLTPEPTAELSPEAAGRVSPSWSHRHLGPHHSLWGTPCPVGHLAVSPASMHGVQ